MSAVWETHRHLSLLVAVLLAQLFLLAYQIKTENNVRLLRRWTVAVISPVEKGFNSAWDGGASLIHNYVALYNAGRENQRLRAELDQTRLRLQTVEARAAEADELATLLQFRQSYPDTILIDRGRDSGLRVNMAVLTPDGVVGKVVEVFDSTAQVLLISDRKSGVGVELADTQVKGVLKGTGSSLCRLEYIPHEETVAVGAQLLTSGQDQLFPKGLPVGQVLSVRPGEFFQEIVIQPAAPLSRLEQVLVLAGAPETLTTAKKTSEGERLER